MFFFFSIAMFATPSSGNRYRMTAAPSIIKTFIFDYYEELFESDNKGHDNEWVAHIDPRGFYEPQIFAFLLLCSNPEMNMTCQIRLFLFVSVSSNWITAAHIEVTPLRLLLLLYVCASRVFFSCCCSSKLWWWWVAAVVDLNSNDRLCMSPNKTEIEFFQR